LASRKVWYIALVCGAIGASTIAYTAVTTHQMIGAAEDAIAEAAKRETVMESDEDSDGAPDVKPGDAKPGDSAKPAAPAAPEKK
jgi:hypothetical protein